jgi:hypothetical protein
VHLPEPIKETGEYTVSVRLHRQVSVDIPVKVTGEGGAQTAGAVDAPAPAPASDAAQGDGPNAETDDAAQA